MVSVQQTRRILLQNIFHRNQSVRAHEHRIFIYQRNKQGTTAARFDVIAFFVVIHLVAFYRQIIYSIAPNDISFCHTYTFFFVKFDIVRNQNLSAVCDNGTPFGRKRRSFIVIRNRLSYNVLFAIFINGIPFEVRNIFTFIVANNVSSGNGCAVLEARFSNHFHFFGVAIVANSICNCLRFSFFVLWIL